MVAFVFALLLGCGQVHADFSGTSKVIPGKYLVRMNPGFLPMEASEGAGDLVVATESQLPELKRLAAQGRLKFEPLRSYSIGPALQHLKNKDSFFDLFNLFSTEDDPLFPMQWALLNTGSNIPPEEDVGAKVPAKAGVDIDAQDAWAHLIVRNEVTIGLIDSGVDYNHEDLKANIDVQDGYDFVHNSADPMDDNGHGTHCAGIIGALHENGVGIRGVMPRVKIIPIKVFGADGSAETDVLVRAVEFAVKKNVDIISASWGGDGSDLLKEAVADAGRHGILFVTAAGNDHESLDEQPIYPADYQLPNVIAVAAYNPIGDLAFFSNYGKNSVHISAPGQNILSTIPNNKYLSMSGTSMATPFVSGAAAMVIAQEGRIDPQALRELIMKTSTPDVRLRKELISMGRLNVANLVSHTIVDRGLPQESQWVASNIPPFSTTHPIGAVGAMVRDFQVPGAKFVRLHFRKVDLSSNSALWIRDPVTGLESEQIPQQSSDYRTDFMPGERIGFRLDSEDENWGLELQAVEYVPR